MKNKTEYTGGSASAMRLLKRLLAKMIGLMVVLSIIFGLMLIFLPVWDFQWLYDFSPSVYYLGIRLFDLIAYNRELTLIVLMLIAFVAVQYKFLKSLFINLSAIYDSVDKLLAKDDEYISMPEELKEIEHKFNDFKRESRKNERLAKENEQKKDELIVYLAHDIKTPLTSMIGYLSLLDEIKDMPEDKQQKYIEIALGKAYKLEDLINELFEVARFNSEKIILEKDELNLGLMIDQIIEDFYPQLRDMGKSINFICPHQTMIYADPDRLGRVFTNLIKNAIYYSSEGSDIDITIESPNNDIATKLSNSDITAKSPNGDVTIEVSNFGRQIPEEKLARIFDNFYRVDSSRTSRTGGSGLGLAISKEIIELHGGKISAESGREKTVFTVVLPIE